MTLHRGSGGRGNRSSERRELVALGQLSESEGLDRSLFSMKLGLLVWTSQSWGRDPHSVSILSYVLQFEWLIHWTLGPLLLVLLEGAMETLYLECSQQTHGQRGDTWASCLGFSSDPVWLLVLWDVSKPYYKLLAAMNNDTPAMLSHPHYRL